MSTDNPDSTAHELFDAAGQQLASLGLPDRLLAGNTGPGLDDSWRALSASGWFRTIVAEADDGLGLGFTELGGIFRAVGHRPLRGPLLEHAVAVPLLVQCAHGLAKETLLSALDGATVVSFAESPAPPYGTGASAVRLNDGYLEGTVDLVPFAQEADEIVVIALSPAGIVIALVPVHDVKVTPTASSDPCIDYATIELNNVPVGDARIIALEAQAVRLREQIRGALRLMAAAEVCGAVEEMTARAVAYAKVRVQFGRPIGGFQAVRHLLATMHVRASSLRSLCDAAQQDADRDPSLVPVLGRAAKAYSAEVGRFVAEQCLQVHGGIGFCYDVPVHLYLRRVLTLQGYLGEPAQLLREVGEAATR